MQEFEPNASHSNVSLLAAVTLEGIGRGLYDLPLVRAGQKILPKSKKDHVSFDYFILLIKPEVISIAKVRGSS